MNIIFKRSNDQPEAIPAADPAATRESFLFGLLSNKVPTPLAMEVPISTLGPSGPKEFPVPRVTQAATAFKNGLNEALTLLGSESEMVGAEEGGGEESCWSDCREGSARSRFNKLTMRPPQAGTKMTCFHIT